MPRQSACFRILELPEDPTSELAALVMSAITAEPPEPVTPIKEPIGEPANDTVVPCEICDTLASGLEAYSLGIET